VRIHILCSSPDFPLYLSVSFIKSEVNVWKVVPFIKSVFKRHHKEVHKCRGNFHNILILNKLWSEIASFSVATFDIIFYNQAKKDVIQFAFTCCYISKHRYVWKKIPTHRLILNFLSFFFNGAIIIFSSSSITIIYRVHFSQY